jgi:hypothetical protein
MVNDHRLYWYGYKRQLTELYYLLKIDNYISCDKDEFVNHFAGKKWGKTTKKYIGKLTWNRSKYLLILLIHHLVEKKFFDYSSKDIHVLKKHFNDITGLVLKQPDRYKKNTISKRFEAKLGCLFPESTGFRCKERRYYLFRNNENIFVVLKKCGIDISL